MVSSQLSHSLAIILRDCIFLQRRMLREAPHYLPKKTRENQIKADVQDLR